MNVLSQFSAEGQKVGLSTVLTAPGYRVAGRLDSDSEGLLILTSNGRVQAGLTQPRKQVWKQYWVQVEGVPGEQALEKLRRGLLLNDGPTLPARADIISPPPLWERSPPVRYRANIPTTWLNIQIQEGRNRQIRRMTAAVGHPTLRLVRHKVGELELGLLQPGEYRSVALPPALMPQTRQGVKKSGLAPRTKPNSRVKSGLAPQARADAQTASRVKSRLVSEARADSQTASRGKAENKTKSKSESAVSTKKRIGQKPRARTRS